MLPADAPPLRPRHATAAAVVLMLAACAPQPAPAPAPSVPRDARPAVVVTPTINLPQLRLMFAALPSRFDSPTNPATPAKIDLGRMLYLDPRLSKAQDLSCNSCHLLDHGGDDGARFSTGHKGQLGGRNAPTVFNAAGQLAQFWDGRAATVEAQAQGPVLNPVEMAMPDPGYVLRVLTSIPGYVRAFAAAFPGEAAPITIDNFGRAIGAFERGLVTPGRFDALLAGDDAALTSAERAGLATFVTVGCTTCHAGPLLGGTMYMKLGLVQPYGNAADQGRFDATKLDSDRMFFKVPSLRNVAVTPPYFHDGSQPDLPTAVREMARLQLGKVMSDADVAAVVGFLEVLTAPPPAAYVAVPALPPSGPRTPAPDPS